jgi:hypothetical protein
MGSLIWIKEARDICPEIQTTQKILILEQIWNYKNCDQKIFSVNLLNTKVIENVLNFPEITRTHESELVYGRYD